MERKLPWPRGRALLALVVSLLLLPVTFAAVRSAGRPQPAPASQLTGSDSPPAWRPDPERSCVHVVQRGESLSRIAARHGTTRLALARANHLAKAVALRSGQRLEVPGCTAERRAHLLASTVGENRESLPTGGDSARASGLRRPASHAGRVGFVWPIHGAMTSGFGRRGFWHWHTGVDIRADRGTPIRAAAPGIVTFSGWESSYGEVIKIAHAGGFSTVYAHNRRNFVRVGDRVNTGTVIAAVGRTGDATGYHLHFEIRQRGLPRNPLPLLERHELEPTMVAKWDGRAPASSVAASASSDRAF